MLPAVKEYAAAKRAKSEAEKAARNAENVMKKLKDSIIKAMNGSDRAVCEHVVLTVKKTADAAATLTMRDGSTELWSKVTGVLMGNVHVPASDIAKLYGGREGPVALDVTGA
jgi:isopentenyl phosphate kinase